MGNNVQVKIVATDESASVFAQTTARIQRWGAESQTASARFSSGFQKASGALTNLAGDIVGTNNKIANLAEGLLTFAVGGGVAAAVAAGITVIVGAYHLLTDGAKKAREETDKLIESQYKLTPAGRRDERIAELDKTNQRIKELRAELDPSGGSNPYKRAPQFLPDPKRVAEINAELGRLVYTRETLMRQGAVPLPDLEATDDSAKRAREAIDKSPNLINRTGISMEDSRRLLAASREKLARRDLDSPVELVKFGADQRAPEGPMPGEGLGTEKMDAFDEAVKGALETMKAFNLETLTSRESLNELASNTLVSLSDGFGRVFSTIGQGKNVFAGLAKAALKPVADEAAGLGKVTILKGLAKIKEGIWPPNPLAIAAGAGMVAAGGALIAGAGEIGGGGGSAGGRVGGGGGGGGGGYGNGQDQYSRERKENGTLTVIWDGDFADPNDRRFQDKMSKTMELAAERGVTRVRFIPRRA